MMCQVLKLMHVQVSALGNEAGPSHHSLVGAVEYLATVVVQDALELAHEFPDNPVHHMLLQRKEFL